ncbi:MAG: DUF2726 domain-containing protein [Clostridiales bacterium]|jgi:hypothetical protein|nr:DUF2726 domain-containing protein [Clostridiales bacterium]
MLQQFIYYVKRLRDSGKIIECEDCGEWHISGTHCVCEIHFAQCLVCGRWHDHNDPCICKIKPEEKAERVYKKKENILTEAEVLFKEKLEKAVDPRKYHITYQTPLNQLVNKTTWGWNSELHRYIDFCVSDKKTTRIILCIEYDDSTHDRPDRKERDKKVDDILSEAGIKLLHIKRNDNMSVDYLKGKLEEYL